MTPFPHRHRLLQACIAALLVVPAFSIAAPRREAVTVDALATRMQAAEARFTRAAVGVRNDDPDARRESDAALQDMEDVMNACMRLRGCPMNSMLASYNRLLKGSVDAETEDDEDDAVDYTPGHGAALAGGVPQAANAAALLADDHRFDRMVEYNPAVQQSIRRWLTDMRGPLIASWENYRNMRHLMWPEFEKRGLPEALLFGIMAKESNGKVHSVSRAGAAGPMQFMYNTGLRFGLGNDGTGFDTRYDPRSAAMASAEYLAERMRQLDGNIELALAGYNGGEGRALRVYQSSRGRPFWDESVYNQFPAETRDYVPMVIAAAWLFLHPKEYGLTLPKVKPTPVALRLAQPASIYQLSICLGNRGVREGYMRTLRNLNPRYQAETFIPAGTTLNATSQIVRQYDRWCTSGARADLARTLVVSDPSRAIVRAGALQQAMPSDDSAPGDPVESNAVPAPTPANGVSGAAAKPVAPRDYRVQEGESLASIARKFRCDVDDLAKANDIKRPNALKRGQSIRLSGCEG
ncbi:MAG TPA: transglycosylase SLT domain-containing protein [Lysobacter sp.]